MDKTKNWFGKNELPVEPKWAKYGRIMEALKKKHAGSVDGSVKMNTRYLYNLFKYKTNDENLVLKVIENCRYNNFKSIYYNWYWLVGKANEEIKVNKI